MFLHTPKKTKQPAHIITQGPAWQKNKTKCNKAHRKEKEAILYAYTHAYTIYICICYITMLNTAIEQYKLTY